MIVVACEGAEQRVAPTGVATRGNEVDGAPETANADSESGVFRKSG